MERVSDADRQRVVEELRGHCAAGRLSIDEYAERVQEVMSAITLSDLAGARRDLPIVRIPEPAPSFTERPAVLRPGVLLGVGAAGVVAGVAAAAALHWFWVLALVVGWLVGVGQAYLSGAGGHRPRG